VASAWSVSQAASGPPDPQGAPQLAPSGPAENPKKAILQLAQQKRWNDVERLAQELAASNPSDPTGWYWMGVARLGGKDSIGAVQSFRSAEKRGLDTSDLHEGLALSYYDLNQFLLFEQEMQRASKLDPLDVRPYFYLGRYQELIKADFVGALAFFKQAVQIKPDDLQSVYHQGYCFAQLGQRDEARECYLKAIGLAEKQSAHFGWPYQGMAQLYLEDNPQEALGWAEKAVAVDPQEYSNHVLLAKVLEKVGKNDDAAREARAAIELNPTSSTARYILFRIYRQTGDLKAAQTELDAFQNLKALYGPE
jgi:tetratricopeptide (TPR) repeat protein